MSYNEWLDIDILEDYLDGKLDAKTMHKVEKLSLEDPFVAEALAGLTESKKRTHSLSILQKQLQERVLQKPVEQKRWRITSHRLSIAAAAAVLFVTVSILFWMREVKRQETAARRAKKIEVNVAPQVAAIKIDSSQSVKAPIIADQTIAQLKSPPLVKYNVDRKADVIVKLPPIVSQSRQVVADSVKVVASRVVASSTPVNEVPSLVTIAKNNTSQNKEIARETSLPGKVEGIRFDANELSKGKPGVLINGVVYTKTDGQPLPGALVKIAGTNKSTTTNANGEFSLSADSNNNTQSLSIAYLGFTTKEVAAKTNQSVNVALEADQKSLNEVVVSSGYSKAKVVRPTPIPANGWANFSSYIVANNRLVKDGAKTTKAVQLTFSVNGNGRPSNIKVVKGLSKAENEEAVRLINEGPNWTVPKNASKKVEIAVGF